MCARKRRAPIDQDMTGKTGEQIRVLINTHTKRRRRCLFFRKDERLFLNVLPPAAGLNLSANGEEPVAAHPNTAPPEPSGP